MKRIFLLCLCICAYNTPQAQVPLTTFEQSNGKRTPTYYEGIDWFQQVADENDFIEMITIGKTDAGLPLHLFIIDKQKEFGLRESARLTILINNAIHAGEPVGVDASMLLIKDIIENPQNWNNLEKIRIMVIPFYNIGGTLNRNSTSRVNQDGPESYGFRGNAKNYDLNRDFTKLDSRNTQSFTRLFTSILPEIYIETHTSNGADYPYNLTYLPTLEEKLGGEAGHYLKNTWGPELFRKMDSINNPIMHYVNSWGTTPDRGWNQFIDHPRYSTGYAALFSTIGMMTEAHMLKPYKNRVHATYKFLTFALHLAIHHNQVINKAVQIDRLKNKSTRRFPIKWEVDQTTFEQIEFSGYKGIETKSNVTTGGRLFYDHDKPYTKKIPFYSNYKAIEFIDAPSYYVLPATWDKVIQNLKNNNINYITTKSDTIVRGTYYKIENVSFSTYPYEGHYPHHVVKVSSFEDEIKINSGDIWIPMNQTGNRLIIEVLEPVAKDSYFRWNYFDTYLQRKEGYSKYVFEELAEELLENDPKLKKQFQKELMENRDFRKDPYSQLQYLYERSPYAEKPYMYYPVIKID